jgi:hypothetical protein
MAQIDTSKIDAQINAQIQKLEELKRFLADPLTASTIKALISEAESFFPVPTKPAETEATTASSTIAPTERGELLGAVEAACNAIAPAGAFNAKHVIVHLGLTGYKFQAKDKFVAVNSALKRLIKRKKLVMVERGIGKRPSTYTLPKRFPRLEKEGAEAA